MARILITSGPTRQYLDPVRYLTNASSGRMGAALAQAVIGAGHQVVIVSGPVEVEYPDAATVVPVVSTEEMLNAAKREFQNCDGAIGVAAPCDYRPMKVSEEKIAKTGGPLLVHLVETVDVIAALGAEKGNRWVVGFALETEDHRFRAITKAEKKKLRHDGIEFAIRDECRNDGGRIAGFQRERDCTFDWVEEPSFSGNF